MPVQKKIEMFIWLPTNNRTGMKTRGRYHSFDQIVLARMRIQICVNLLMKSLTQPFPYCSFSDYTFKYHRIDLIHPEKPCSHFGTYAAKGKYTFCTHSKTSTNGHLSTTAIYLGPRGRSSYSNSLFNGHFSTTAMATKIVSQLSK